MPRLVIDSDFADPDLLTVDGTVHAYATNNTRHNIPFATASSVDGDWTLGGDALPRLGSWARTGLTWAPDVSRRDDGSFLMYYTARDVTHERQAIGAAVADRPEGPFEPVGDQPLVCPAEAGGAIDPAAFVDRDGTRYLLYKNDGNAIGVDTWIHLQRVGSDGIGFEGEPVRLLRQDRPEEHGLVEAPTLVARESGFLLFYSAGHFGDAGYFTSYASSPTLSGPYLKADRPLLSTGSTGITGPGGQDVVSDGGRDWIVFHGILRTEPLVRGMYVAELTWDDAGRPAVLG